MKKISQREARALRKRVAELEHQQVQQRNAWVRDYPGGVNLGSISLDPQGWLIGRIAAARMLGHLLVATEREDGRLYIYAVK